MPVHLSLAGVTIESISMKRLWSKRIRQLYPRALSGSVATRVEAPVVAVLPRGSSTRETSAFDTQTMHRRTIHNASEDMHKKLHALLYHANQRTSESAMKTSRTTCTSSSRIPSNYVRETDKKIFVWLKLLHYCGNSGTSRSGTTMVLVGNMSARTFRNLIN